MGYMRGLTHTFGVHRSDKAHQRVGLSQSIRLPSLIGAEEHAIVRAVGTHVRSCACLPSPRRRGNQDQEPGNQHTLLVVSGTTPGKRRRSLRGGAEARRRVNSRLLPCWCPFRIRTRSARVGHHCSGRQRGEALPRPRCWRPARRIQPQRGHLCGWPEHNY